MGDTSDCGEHFFSESGCTTNAGEKAHSQVLNSGFRQGLLRHPSVFQSVKGGIWSTFIHSDSSLPSGAQAGDLSGGVADLIVYLHVRHGCNSFI